jgi:xanthine/CO dehydrogenase XdhC/CoxF family maturation factor
VKELVDIVRIWERKRGEPFALATLVQAQGSSYRRPGARMLIAPDGSTVGSLSGGCLEEEVADRARTVLRTGEASLMEFDTRRRFGCNGCIRIFVEAVSDNFLAGLATALHQRRRSRAVTVFAENETERGTRLLAADGPTSSGAFVQEIAPPVQLIVFGEGPDSRPLASIAALLGWSVINIEQASELPDNADERTAAVIKSHNYGRDFAALRHLLQLDLAYVGLLGPRQRRDQLLGDLLDAGVAIAAELFAPAGLDLGAETPEEIALAIIAEIQTVLAGASGESLRDRKVPIHGWNVARPSPRVVQECETSAP